MTLVRSVQISKRRDWYACNHHWLRANFTLCVRLSLCSIEKQTPCSIVSKERKLLQCVHAEYQFLWGLFCECLFCEMKRQSSQPRIISFIWVKVKEQSKREIYNNGVQRELQQKKALVKMESNTKPWNRCDFNLWTSLQYHSTTTAFPSNTQHTAAAQGLCGCTSFSYEY